MRQRTLNHVTLASGHIRDSPRSGVGDDVIEMVRPLLERALTGEMVAIPNFAGYTMSGGVHGACCAVTIWRQIAETATPEPEPLVTVGVAPHSRCGARLWRSLHDDFPVVPVKTDRAKPPAEPWCAAVLHPAAVMDQPALYWIADFERVIAWAFIEMREADND